MKSESESKVSSIVADTDKIEKLQSAIEACIEQLKIDFANPNDSASSLLNRFAAITKLFKEYHPQRPSLLKIAARYFSSKAFVSPSFIASGAVGSGHDLLSHYLMQHPCVPLPPGREFVNLPIFTERFYKAHFPCETQVQEVISRNGFASVGMFASIMPSTSWIYWAKALNPHMKFVFVLRDPVARALSHWRWNNQVNASVRRNALWDTQPNLLKAMQIEAAQISDAGCGFHLHEGAGATSYLRHGIYLPFLKTLESAFGSGAYMLVDYDELVENPSRIMQSVYEFLELPNYVPKRMRSLERAVSNFGSLEPDETEVRQLLVDFYRPYNLDLSQHVQRDFSWSHTTQSRPGVSYSTEEVYVEEGLLSAVGVG